VPPGAVIGVGAAVGCCVAGVGGKVVPGGKVVGDGVGVGADEGGIGVGSGVGAGVRSGVGACMVVAGATMFVVVVAVIGAVGVAAVVALGAEEDGLGMGVGSGVGSARSVTDSQPTTPLRFSHGVGSGDRRGVGGTGVGATIQYGATVIEYVPPDDGTTTSVSHPGYNATVTHTTKCRRTVSVNVCAPVSLWSSLYPRHLIPVS
jgi:hypothetical protein